MVYMLICAALCIQLQAMETEPTRMLHDETTPLVPQRLKMIDHTHQTDPQSVFYNGTRAFYNDESRKRAQCNALKECLCLTAQPTLCLSCAGCLLGNSMAGCMVACGVRSGFLIPGLCGLFTEMGSIPCGIIFLIASAHFGPILIHKIKEETAHDAKIRWHWPLEIPPEMLKSADENKAIWIEKEKLIKLIDRAISKSRLPNDCFLRWIKRMATDYYQSEKEKINTLKQRLNNLRSEYNKVAAQTRLSFIKNGLSNDVINVIFTHVRLPNLSTFSYITEKELLYIIRDLTHHGSAEEHPHICYLYATQALLAKKGWFSFIKTEKYPIKCEHKYFDSKPLSENINYQASNGQTIYLPYSPEIARFYKFEKDPAYQAEFKHPSNLQILALLQERKKILLKKQPEDSGQNKDDGFFSIEL